MSSLRNAVIYHILIDRFAGFAGSNKWDKPEYIGGNLKGITDKLPYIKELGADVIWLSPFYRGVAYHGYHTTDFYKVDPHFGSEADLQKLIAKAHKMGLKVIADFVPNHCSIEHPFFKDAQQRENSRYRNWFIFDKWPQEYRSFLHAKELAKLNLDNQEVMEHMQGAARKWLALGLDGYRIDHVIGLSHENLERLLAPLRQEFPDAVYIGEAWMEGVQRRDMKTIRAKRKWLAWLLADRGSNVLYHSYAQLLDGVLSFKLAKLFEQYAQAEHRDKQRLEKAIHKQAAKHLPELLQFTFLDNHDMERFLFRCGGDKERLKAAVSLQFALDQPAIIYYGSEIGMTQKRPFNPSEPHTDMHARMPMEWNEANWDKDLLEFYKQQIELKKRKSSQWAI